ncbi:MAG: Wzz/FepE/Etk N-terminal domain-containing protein [candidate division WOR-3 bacterium]
MSENMSYALLSYISILLKRRKFIIKFIGIVTIIGIVTSFVLIQQFTATATILPPNTQQDAMFGLLSTGILGSMTTLGRLGNILPGTSTPSDLFAAVMQSDRIKDEIINKFNLMKEFKCKTMTDARKELKSITKITVNNEGIVSVSVTYKNKYLAANIANAYIEELDKFNTQTAMTVGKKYRIFIERRLKENIDSLANAEEALRKFQEKHRTVALDIEIENAIATIAKLKSEIILREVQKGTIASENGINNPFVANIDRELRELKRQLARIEFGTQDTTRKEFGAGFSMPFAKLPELSLEYARLLRELKVQEAIYELLTQQYEQAKIMEAKDTPSVQFLDRASPPEKKSFPRRGKIIMLFFAISLLLSIFLSFLLEYIQQLRKIPAWQNVFDTVVNDFRKIKQLTIQKFRRK